MGQTRIDEGFRAWYASCSCCLGEAHPDVKAALDVEAAEQQAPEAHTDAPGATGAA